MMQKTITVCSSCLMASCWQNIFSCGEYKFAGTVEKTRDELEKLNLEHSDYWKTENEPKEKIRASNNRTNFIIEIDVPLLLRNHDIRANHYEATAAIENYLENYLKDNIQEVLNRCNVKWEDVI